MPRPPYMNFPFQFYRNYYKPPFDSHNTYGTQTNDIQSRPLTPRTINSSAFQNSNEEERQNLNSSRNLKEKNKSNKYTDVHLFDLFGLKIYNDDILIMSLIYFLYSEGVKDDSLFLVLILLLLS